MQPRQVDLSQVVSEVLALLHSDPIQRRVADARLARDRPPLFADPVQLQQVTLNLLLNACDAMRGWPVVERADHGPDRLRRYGWGGTFGRGPGDRDPA